MPMKNRKSLSLCFLSLIALAACADVKDTIGLGRKSPDEFAVVERAPLSMPPGFDLRPPQPGAPRPVEVTAPAGSIRGQFAADQNNGVFTSGTQDFLSQAGAANANPDIRRQVDAESKGVVAKDKGMIDRLVNYNDRKDPDPIVDPAAEKARLQNAEQNKQPVTGDDAATIERKRRAPLEGIF